MSIFKNSVPFGNTVSRTLAINYDSLRVDSYARSGQKIYNTVTASISASYSSGSNSSSYAVPPEYTAQGTKASFYFNGSGSYFFNTSSVNPASNFTVNIWCRPTKTVSAPAQINNGISTLSGNGIMIDPVYRDPSSGTTYCSSGLSIGKNAVVVMEHTNGYAPAVLVYTSSFSTSSFTNICLVYRNRQPILYVNGSYVYAGVAGARTISILNPAYIGSSASNGWGNYEGDISLISIYTSSLSDAEIFQNYNVLRSRYS